MSPPARSIATGLVVLVAVVGVAVVAWTRDASQRSVVVVPPPAPDASVPTASEDAASESDASDLLAHELATIVAANVCAKRAECECSAYETPEGTSCEADVTRDFLARWPRHVPPRIPITRPTLDELEVVLDKQITCDSTILDVSTLLVADVGPGERCGYLGVCRGGLACRDGVCRAGTRGDPCRDRRCERGRWRGPCPVGAFERLAAPGGRDSSSECVPIGAACSFASDCGSGSCEGAGPRVCMPAGPHAVVHSPSAPRMPLCGSSDAVCDTAGYGTTYCGCPVGFLCEYEVGEFAAHCRPLRRAGTSCRNDDCEPGLSCDRLAPAGGRCVPRLCTTHHFFVDLERPYSPWGPD